VRRDSGHGDLSRAAGRGALRAARRALPARSRLDVPARARAAHDPREPELQYYAEFKFPDLDSFKAVADSEDFRATGKDAAEMGVAHSVYLVAVD
jgi:hypothetical protein